MFKTIFIDSLIVLSVLFFSLNQQKDQLAVHFLDIGQGDAILIRTPQGQNILIDGGPDNAVVYQLAEVLPWWERTIDYVVLTHYHADHVIGLVEVFDKYKVNNVLINDHQPDHMLHYIFKDALEEHNLKPTIVTAGEKFVLADNLSWQVLLSDDYHEDYNDNSIVMRLSYGDIDFLFTGDLTTIGEERLLSTGLVLESEVLKVCHHGSKYSSSEKFLEKVQPEICIIQSGKNNKFGHPHQEALDRLNNIGCQIKSNEHLGTISIFSDGHSLY
ncbi:MBL fold metallo-hydrolase [bacterium]|nr:MBL fold metallo-hydrolase [bacterium]